jgi:hypothetical protein
MDKENQDIANLKEQIRFLGPDSMLGQPEYEAGTVRVSFCEHYDVTSYVLKPLTEHLLSDY